VNSNCKYIKLIKESLLGKILFALVILFIICLVFAAGYSGAVIYIKKHGINLKPSREYEPSSHIKIFMQNDSQWAEDSIGKSHYKMKSHGCLVSVIASVCEYHGVNMDPGKLNEVFTKNGVYTKDGNVIWYKINSAIPTIDYKYRRIFSRKLIEKDLEKGLLPVVMVKYRGSGIHHWVSIVGASNGEFLIVDPLSSEIIPLSVHGRVYAYRVLAPVDEKALDLN